MWGLSTSALQAAASAGIWVAALAGAIAVVASLVSAVAANEASNRLQRESDRRIAESNAQAASARLETEQLRARMAWRRVTPVQREKLITALKGLKGPVWTEFVGSDPEATLFRKEIDEAMRAAGIETNHFSGWEVALGLQVIGEPSPERDQIAEAFRAAGIHMEVFAPHERRVPPAPGKLVVLVGSKIDGLRISQEAFLPEGVRGP